MKNSKKTVAYIKKQVQMHMFYIIQFTFKKIKKRSEGVWFAVDTCAV